jgi:glycosyltransferase involved in cell wall biosynthesis
VKLVSVLTPCFRSEPYLEGYFRAVLAQTLLDQLEVVLVLNEPSEAELAIVDRVMAQHPGLVKPIVCPEGWDARQSAGRGARSIARVSQSYNRALSSAEGTYVAQWDHDDIRVPDSLEAEVRTLKDHPHALMTYGDMVVVRRYGDTTGEQVTAPEYDKDLFMRGCFGSFRMWRRDALSVTGLFDEQFLSGGDLDLWVRFAANGEQVRTPQVLGYWLNAGAGLSTSGDDLQPVERTVIELRYGILDKIDRRYVSAASRYRVGEVRFGDEWIPVGRFVPGLDDMLARAAADPRVQPSAGVRDRVVQRMRNVARRARGLLRSDGGQP